MLHPFADRMGLQVDQMEVGRSQCSLTVDPERHFNPHRVVHGAVLYALADTGMGAALYPTLSETETCATVEIKINYFRAIRAGSLTCVTEMVHRGRTMANLESRVYCEGRLVAQANGNFAIVPLRTEAPTGQANL